MFSPNSNVVIYVLINFIQTDYNENGTESCNILESLMTLWLACLMLASKVVPALNTWLTGNLETKNSYTFLSVSLHYIEMVLHFGLNESLKTVWQAYLRPVYTCWSIGVVFFLDWE